MPFEASTMESGSSMETDGGSHRSEKPPESTHLPSAASLMPLPPNTTRNGVGNSNVNGANGANGLACDHALSPPDENHTCYHPHHSVYSETNLPPLLFQLDPPETEPTGKIGNLTENGKPVLDYSDKLIRAFPFLPRYISTRARAWLLEYWMRTDSRLSYRDIKARMVEGRKGLPTDNALNMRRERDARSPLGLSCWTARRGTVTKAEVERVEKLSADQVALNTTMDVEYGFVDGVNQPVALRSKSVKSHASRLYALDTFISMEDQPHTPSDRLTQAIDLFHELQGAAFSLGVDDWRVLPVEKQPKSWVQKSLKLKKEHVHDVKKPTMVVVFKTGAFKPSPQSIVDTPQSLNVSEFVPPANPFNPNPMSYGVAQSNPEPFFYTAETKTVSPRQEVPRRRYGISIADLIHVEPGTEDTQEDDPAPVPMQAPMAQTATTSFASIGLSGPARSHSMTAEPVVRAAITRPLPPILPREPKPWNLRDNKSHKIYKNWRLHTKSNNPFARVRGDADPPVPTFEAQSMGN